jgi:transketolase N-terminal domain/subunit
MTLTLRSISEEPPKSAAEDLEEQLARAAAFTRKHAIAAIYHAGSGHPGGAMSCADLLACLFGAELNFWPNAHDDPDRDRFVLSKGHAAPALYAVAAHYGFCDPKAALSLRKLGSRSRAIRMCWTCPGSRPRPARSARASRSRSAWRWA